MWWLAEDMLTNVVPCFSVKSKREPVAECKHALYCMANIEAYVVQRAPKNAPANRINNFTECLSKCVICRFYRSLQMRQNVLNSPTLMLGMIRSITPDTIMHGTEVRCMMVLDFVIFAGFSKFGKNGDGM